MISCILVNCLSTMLKTLLVPQEETWQTRKGAKGKTGAKATLEVPTQGFA